MPVNGTGLLCAWHVNFILSTETQLPCMSCCRYTAEKSSLAPPSHCSLRSAPLPKQPLSCGSAALAGSLQEPLLP